MGRKLLSMCLLSTSSMVIQGGETSTSCYFDSYGQRIERKVRDKPLA
ncbi:hypothetical protein [Xenorhabdus mauleonii]|nr:hypothetical protein [Xenorhabdus mauleonii]